MFNINSSIVTQVLFIIWDYGLKYTWVLLCYSICHTWANIESVFIIKILIIFDLLRRIRKFLDNMKVICIHEHTERGQFSSNAHIFCFDRKLIRIHDTKVPVE